MRRSLKLIIVGALAVIALPVTFAGVRGAHHGPPSGSAFGVARAEAPAHRIDPVHPSRPVLRLVTPTDTTIRLPNGRSYVLHTRIGAAAVPLVVVLPGLFHTWPSIAQAGDWSSYADRHGFAVVYGIGVDESWNAGSCCGAAQRERVDDVSYLVSVVQDAERRESIDPTRVYVVGFSNGDMMAIRAECDRPDVFAAAGGSAGAPVAPCDSPLQQVRIRHLHGRYDTTVPYAGGYSRLTGTDFPPVSRYAALIIAGSPTAVVSVSTLPCAHAWPRADNACRVNGTDLLWRWISRYHRPPLESPARTLHPLLQ